MGYCDRSTGDDHLSMLMIMYNADYEEISILIWLGLCLCNRHQYSSNGTISPGAVGDCSYFSGTPESSLREGEFFHNILE